MRDDLIDAVVIAALVTMVVCLLLGTGLLVAVVVALLTGHYS